MSTTGFSRDLLFGLSGEEYMRRMLDGRIAAPQMWATSNITLSDVAQGQITLHTAPLPAHGNIIGTVHGGWYGIVLDAAMGCACMSCVPEGATHTTLEYKVNIVRPAKIGTELIATGHVQHSGRSTLVANGEVRGRDDNRLYATGSTTCIVLQH